MQYRWFSSISPRVECLNNACLVANAFPECHVRWQAGRRRGPFLQRAWKLNQSLVIPSELHVPAHVLSPALVKPRYQPKLGVC